MNVRLPKKRIEEIDVLRGIAAISMILGHSFIVYPVDVTSVPWCHWLGHYIYAFHMELFFVLAGAVYKCDNYKRFIKKKVKRILIPYIFFGLLSFVFKAFGGAAINGVEDTQEGLVKFFFHGGNYWFLYVLFILFAIYPWLEKVLRSKWSKVLLALFSLIIRQFTEVTTLFALSSVLYYIPYFIAGELIVDSLYKEGTSNEISKKCKVSIITISIALFIFLDYLDITNMIKMESVFSFVRAMAIIIILYSAIHFCIKKIKVRGAIYTFFSDCGKYSLQLYLFNGFLLTGFRMLICNILNISSPIIIVGGIWIGNLIITLIACKYLLPKIPLIRNVCGIN